MELDEALQVLASLERERVDYVLVGGAALTFHGLVRATEDLDLFVRPTAENIERLLAALRAVYNDPSIDEISTEDLLGDYPAVRYYPPEGDLFLDILTRRGEFASFEDLEAQEVESRGIKIKVASPATLYRLKRDTVREIDRVDAQKVAGEVSLGGALMPVKKFRSVEEMPPVEWCETVDEECFRRIARLWARSSAFSARVYPRGVFKFRSIEEAQQARERVTQENIDRLRRERQGQIP